MPHTLLLADDSVTIQRVIELTFADEDVQVVAVSDGDQAIERLDSAPPDIVLADIGMPGRNGYEVARYIRQTPKLAHIPVVLLTGAFEPVDQVKAAEVGCDGVLAKPFEPQLVIGRVKELLATPTRRAPQSLDANLAPPPAPAGDQWTAPLVDQSLGQAAPAAEATGNLDDYFDRLDSAFANLSGNTPAASAPASAVAAGSEPAAPSPAADSLDWLRPPTGAAQPPHDEPVAEPEPAPPATAPPPPAIAAPASAAPVAAAPVAPAPVYVPTIADAFVAILEAEQSEAGPAARPVWPASSGSSPASASAATAVTAVTDDVVDRIATRVLAQLSDHVVRETVSGIAERLVREEIERIKASIK